MKFHKLAFLMAGVLLLSACSETKLISHWAKRWPGQQESRGTYKVGNPYKVGSVWYYPNENFQLSETGIASWYGPGFHASTTANGEVFDQQELTAAHRTLQLPSLARVTNLENGRSVVVRVNDRGPFKNGRIIDVSMRAAELLGFISKGTARIRLDVLEKESRILAATAQRGEDTTRLTAKELNEGAPVETAAVNRPAPTPVKMASLASDADTLPESLRTPTITVEDLAVAGARPSMPASSYPPVPVPRILAPGRSAPDINSGALAPGRSAPDINSGALAPGRVESGRFMPAHVVSTAVVHPTGIFVQAGAFSVRGNAERLAQRLTGIAPVLMEDVVVNGRTLYRVRLGPMKSVDAADRALEKVIQAGQSDAKVINKRG